MTSSDDMKRKSKYWICGDCAKKRKWTCNGVVTVIHGLCGHCERKDEIMLTPVVDFDGPNGKRAIYD